MPMAVWRMRMNRLWWRRGREKCGGIGGVVAVKWPSSALLSFRSWPLLRSLWRMLWCLRGVCAAFDQIVREAVCWQVDDGREDSGAAEVRARVVERLNKDHIEVSVVGRKWGYGTYPGIGQRHRTGPRFYRGRRCSGREFRL